MSINLFVGLQNESITHDTECGKEKPKGFGLGLI